MLVHVCYILLYHIIRFIDGISNLKIPDTCVVLMQPDPFPLCNRGGAARLVCSCCTPFGFFLTLVIHTIMHARCQNYNYRLTAVLLRHNYSAVALSTMGVLLRSYCAVRRRFIALYCIQCIAVCIHTFYTYHYK